MKKLLLFATFITLVLSLNCFAQQNNIDSLLTLLKTTKEDTTKVKILNNLFLHYEFTDDEKAGEYLNKALSISQSIVPKGIAKKSLSTTYIHLGYFEEDKGNYPEALKNYLHALEIKQETGDKQGVADSYNNIGSVYYAQGNYPEALKNYFASLKIFEAIGNKKDNAASHNNIGIIYYNQGNYPEALKNHFASLKIKEAIGDKAGVSYSYNNIGNVYVAQGNYQEALNNYFASLKIKEAMGDKKGIASSYNNIGLVYYDQANYQEALKNYYASLKIKEEIGDNAGIATSYSNIGKIFIKQRKYNEAEKYLIKAKELSQKIGHKKYLRDTFIGLMNLDSAKGNYKGAYENHKLYILYRDSIDNEETRKKTIQGQMTYDFEKKEAVATAEHKKELENQHALADEKSRKQKAVLLLVSCVLLLVFVFAGFIFRSLRITRKQKHIIELQKKRVEQQKQEVEHQKLLVEEHQKEIIDSITYAKRLQQAILPSEEEINKYLPDSFIFYKPKDIVAGDFYWMHVVQFENVNISQPSNPAGGFENIKKENNKQHQLVFIAAADSTGHGVPGAMVSVVCSNALNRAVNEFKLIDTGKILDKTRELVLETFAKSGEEIKDGMDISLLCLRYQVQSSKLLEVQWSGANNPLWFTEQIPPLKGNVILTGSNWFNFVC